MQFRHRKIKASLSVEAAFVIPICFFALYTMLYYYVLMNTEFVVFQSMLAVSDKVYAYGAEQAYMDNAGLGDSILKNLKADELPENVTSLGRDVLARGVNLIMIKGYLKEYFSDKNMDLTRVNNGINGIDLSASKVMSDSNEVVLVAHYTFNFPEIMFSMGKKRISARIRFNTFYGTNWEDIEGLDENIDKSYVYIAPTGEVYHLDKACTYIKLNLQQVDISAISSLRSEDGCIYYPCEKCGKKQNDGKVYILSYGSRYHTQSTCSKIKRDVTRVTAEEAKELGRRPCSKCAKDE